MNGRLDEHSLAEVIQETSAAGLTGAVRLERERAKAVVYFEAGRIIFVASNLRAHRLSECLRRWGAVEDGLALAAGGEAVSDAKLAAALIETGALTPQRADELLARQASDILRGVLLWTEGTWAFDPRVRLGELTRVNIAPHDLLLESARRLPPEFIARKFTSGDEKLSLESGGAEDLRLLPAEAFVLSRFDASVSVREITAIGGLPEEDTLRAVYALALGGFLRRENGSRLFSPEEVEDAKILASRAPQSKPDAPPSFASVAGGKVKSRAEAAPDTPAPPTPEKEAFDARKELDELFARLADDADYYRALDIHRDAGASEIKAAYYGLAKRFHPDRFHHEADPVLNARVEAAFAQIKRAYETLKDKSLRAGYDRKLDAKEKAMRSSPGGLNQQQRPPGTVPAPDSAVKGRTPPSDARPTSPSSAAVQQAEDFFQQGLKAHDGGNAPLAVKCFGEAARLAPDQPRYRAYYGRALSSSAQTRRQAEGEIQKAISLDANNVSYRIMLAELYRSIGLPRRAEGELKLALSIDPRNDAARRLLGDLQTTLKN